MGFYDCRCMVTGVSLKGLDGCVDVDIWPTPFTNSFPIRREPMAVGERRQFLMAWIFAPDLTVRPQPHVSKTFPEMNSPSEDESLEKFFSALTGGLGFPTDVLHIYRPGENRL